MRRSTQLADLVSDYQPPRELAAEVAEFFPDTEWVNALNIAYLESAWEAFALNDTTDDQTPCGATITVRDGIEVTAERSVGYFQINACNFPTWEWQRLYNARHNVGTAHMLWQQAGCSWSPWLFSARKLGLA